MFCPRCGTENDEGNRFCVSCGAPLASKDPESGKPARPESPGRALGQIVGTTRRARVLTALTVLAVAVAVIAFIALKSGGGEEGAVPQDAYLRQLDRQCVQEKQRLSTLEAETLQQKTPNFAVFVNYLVRYVTEWHSNVQASPPPPEHVEGVRALEGALLDVLVEAGTLGTSIRDGSAARIAHSAAAVDAATSNVDPALEVLGLEHCPEVSVGPPTTTG